MLTAIDRQVAAAREGRDPSVVARMASGWAVLGERQFLRGYTLLLADPVVPDLNALDSAQRAAFFLDLAQLGDAVLEVTGAVRINYAILGNLEPALHAHVIPRYADEPVALRTLHPWAYDWQSAPRLDPFASRDLIEGLRRKLARGD